ncbi:PilC-like protein with beta-propeller domain [Geothermobacter ehrlichii]|uniref:PilC-like protein with beta-propeller domain n=1 Tax=Geothermobacter ehrlichii TaxID=213224 RepID=A0A5D3WLF1_9BACT|nr:PilC/PilY family type IV pilus protein [Geothermobacter ehrlichii]TYO99932.1 PilC-like protein with beta-propeller domain [Geothermobacter ehrlichii]
MKGIGKFLALIVVILAMAASPARAAKMSFPAGSLIVPMDPCWQPNNDPNLNAVFRSTGCDADLNDNGLYQAYGMIYEILRSGAKVAWVVRPDKVTPDDVDFTIAGQPDLTTGDIIPPVKKVDRTKTDPANWPDIDPPARTLSWTDNAGTSVTENFDAHVIDYRGGPFVIHKKFLTTEVLQIVNAFADVKVHSANVSFSAPIDKVLDKVPPKLAILGSGKVDILRSYLQAAGLLGLETLVFNEVTVPEIIEDVLTTPDADGNTYSLFWAPHWVIMDEINGPVTLSDGTVLTADEARVQVLQKLRAFMEAGNSAFLECASIESIEGSEDMEKSGGGVDDASIDAQGGWVTDKAKPGPRLYTDGGLMDPDQIIYDKPSGFLTQCAGWIYTPQGGHVHNFKPHANVGGLYNNTVERFAHDPDGAGGQGYDYYVGGRINGSPSQGYVTYLAGHRYLECNNTWTPPGGTTTTVATAPTKRIFDLVIDEPLDPADQVVLSFYYSGSPTAIDVTMSPDGSLNFADEDGVLLSDLDQWVSSQTAGKTHLEGIALSNLSPLEQTIEKVVVTWPSSGVASSCTPSGTYSAVLKSESKQKDKTLCVNTPPGTVCDPGPPLHLKDYHKDKKWDKTPPQLEVTVTENTDVFQFGFRVNGSVTPLSFELDLSAEFKPAATGNYDIKRSDTIDLKDASGQAILYVKLDKVSYKFNSDGSFDKVVIKFKEISRANGYTGDVDLDDMVVDWSCVNVVAVPGYTLYENGTAVASGENGAADTGINLTLGAVSTGSGSTDPATSPTIDPSYISYCDIKKNNTCGTRFVLNTVLGLQFTVITSTYVQSSPIIDGSLAFQGSYEFPTYRGHFQAIDISSNWDAASAIVWDAAEVMPPAGTGNPATISSSPASRYIFTNNGTTKVGFDINAATKTTDYLHLQMGLATIEETQAWINTVRGRDKATPLLVAGEGERPNRLWGIRTSTPAIVGSSSLIQDEHRDRIAYVGGDDGMLHAFYAGSYDSTTGKYTAGTGKEIWAYIPSTLLPFLQQQDYVDPNKEPVVSVSGSPAVRDVLMPIKDANGNVVGTEYRTILIATATVAKENRGLIFALDVTDPYTPKVLWETDLSPYNVGDAKGVALGKVRLGDSIGNWVFLTANYHQPLDANGNVDTNNGSYGINLLALDVFTGQFIWQWHDNYPVNGNVSATPAPPSLLDYDNNGVVDYIVFGDLAGRLWQIPSRGPEKYQEYDPDTQSMVWKTKSISPAYAITDANGTLLGVPIGAPVALYGKTAIFGTGGTDFAPDNMQYGLYAVKLHDPPGGSLLWKAESIDAVGTGNFLAMGEKIWGAPTIDGQGRIYIATGKGYREQDQDAASTIDKNTQSTGRVMVLSSKGKLLGSVTTESAAVGSVEIVEGGAVATDFSGNMLRLGNPTAVGDYKGIRVKVFSWRLR